jgi:Fe-S cluster assembly protein SufB
LSKEKKIIKEVTEQAYKYGFVSKLQSDTIEKGLSENVIKIISKKKNEPKWMLEKRLQAFEVLKTLEQPKWAKLDLKELNLQDIIYYSAPKKKIALKSLDEADPELIKTFNKLGISKKKQKRLAGVPIDCL